jgi:hypothetical protein
VDEEGADLKEEAFYRLASIARSISSHYQYALTDLTAGLVNLGVRVVLDLVGVQDRPFAMLRENGDATHRRIIGDFGGGCRRKVRWSGLERIRMREFFQADPG